MSFIDEIAKLQIEKEKKKVNKVHSRCIEALRERNSLQSDLLDIKRDYAKLQNKLSETENELCKIKDAANTYRELREEIKTLQCERDAQDEMIESLKEEISNLKSEQAEQIADLKSELKIEAARRIRADEAAEYYKKLAENFQSMPDLKKLVDNIAGFKVPDIKEFVDSISKLNSVQEPMKESFKGVESEVSHLRSAIDYLINTVTRGHHRPF